MIERVAIISDIHGNLPALTATLADIRARGIARIICLGDVIGKGPHSAEAVDRCREVCEAIVGGNWEAVVLEGIDEPVFNWPRERLGADRLAYLATLPSTVTLSLSGRQIRLFHASPVSVHYRVRQRDPIEKLQAMFDNTDFTGHDYAPDVVGYGDVHTAFVRTFPQKLLFNVGSVGNPLDITQASYAILEGYASDGRAAPFGVHLVRVPYDIERAIQDAIDLDIPSLDAYARELRTAVYRGAHTAQG